MKQMHSGLFLPFGLALVLFLLDGCVTNTKTTYLQEYDISMYEADSIFEETYKLQIRNKLHWIKNTQAHPR